eukprot:scaffold209828_cov23-Tisochrysis_lutea.AAC.3
MCRKPARASRAARSCARRSVVSDMLSPAATDGSHRSRIALTARPLAAGRLRLVAVPPADASGGSICTDSVLSAGYAWAGKASSIDS